MAHYEQQPYCGSDFEFPVAADAVIDPGQGVVINASGYAVPAAAGAGLKTAGVAKTAVNNTGGTNGAKRVVVNTGRRREIYRFDNSQVNPVTQANLLGPVWWAGASSLAGTDGGATRSAAGTFFGFDRNNKLLVDVSDPSLSAQGAALPTFTVGATAAMVAGVVTVSSLTLAANSEIVFSRKTLGGTAGQVAISARTNGTGTGSFTLTSGSNTETSTFSYQIITPAA